MIFLQLPSSSPNAVSSNKLSYKKPVIQILYADDEETKAQKCEVVCSSRQLGDAGGGRIFASDVNVSSFPPGSLSCL